VLVGDDDAGQRRKLAAETGGDSGHGGGELVIEADEDVEERLQVIRPLPTQDSIVGAHDLELRPSGLGPRDFVALVFELQGRCPVPHLGDAVHARQRCFSRFWHNI
jgi:hypothetical protein